MLTVIGYSVMDTIVILDRIRENTKLMAGEPYDKIVNTSILQTMTRSVNTLATVVITLVALLALGGASLQNFAFALLVGICSGGYHSIFYSAPLVVRLRERQLRWTRPAGGAPSSAAKSSRSAGSARGRSPRRRRNRGRSSTAPRSSRSAASAGRKKRRSVRGGPPAHYRRKRADEPLPAEVDESADALRTRTRGDSVESRRFESEDAPKK